MIVPMKKATLVCLASDREPALEKLREMGIMHLQFELRGDTLEQGDARHMITDIDKVSASNAVLVYIGIGLTYRLTVFIFNFHAFHVGSGKG